MGLIANSVLYASVVVIAVAFEVEGDAVDGGEVDAVDGNEITVADGFQVGSTSSETYLDGLSEVAKEAMQHPDVHDNITALMEWNTGAPVPPAALSFPGCHCNWNDPGWTCEGSAVFPRLMEGKTCCCCGIHCKMGRRCTDDQCWSIGVDQGDEVREQEKKWKEMMKNADFAINGDLPVKVVELERGRCTNNGIEHACRKYQMTPVCDHNAYVSMKRCYTLGIKGTKYYNRHISHWASHRQHMGFPEEIERHIHGMCFMGNNGNWALAPYDNSHRWTASGGRYYARHTPYPPTPNSMDAGQIDQCRPRDKQGWGCWRTFCVPREPNYNDPNTRR